MATTTTTRDDGRIRAAIYDDHARASSEFHRCMNARDAGFYDESSPRLVRARERLRTTWFALQRMRADADVRAITGRDATANDRLILADVLVDEIEGGAK